VKLGPKKLLAEDYKLYEVGTTTHPQLSRLPTSEYISCQIVYSRRGFNHGLKVDWLDGLGGRLVGGTADIFSLLLNSEVSDICMWGHDASYCPIYVSLLDSNGIRTMYMGP